MVEGEGFEEEELVAAESKRGVARLGFLPFPEEGAEERVTPIKTVHELRLAHHQTY